MSFWVAGAAVVAGVGGAVIGKKASDKAAGAAGKASDLAIAEQQRQFDLVRSDTAGQRFIGNKALDTLSRLYGYGPTNFAAGTGERAGNPLMASLPSAGKIPGGSLNIGGTLASKLGTVGKILDPAAALFGNKHGDERRNLRAFMADNEIMDLGNGMAQLPDGRTFPIDKLQDVAGAYYGARYHPDGNQGDWQQRYNAMLTAPAPESTPTTGATQTPAGPDMSVFFASPDYQFRVGETQKAVDRSAAARGGLLSGAAAKAGARYAGNLASAEYGSFIDRLFQQAGIGSTGIGASAAAGANAAGNIGQAYTNAGNARASAYLTGGEALNNGLQGTASNLLLMKYLGTAPRV